MKLLPRLILASLISSPGLAANGPITGRSRPGAAPAFSPGIAQALNSPPRVLTPSLVHPQAPTDPELRPSLVAPTNPLTRSLARSLADLGQSLPTNLKTGTVSQKTFAIDSFFTGSKARPNQPDSELSVQAETPAPGRNGKTKAPLTAPRRPAPADDTSPKNAAGKYLGSVLHDNLFNSPSRKAITRGVQEYSNWLGARFSQRLLQADNRDHLMDLGAGEAVFATELAGQRPIGPSVLDASLRALDQRARDKLPNVTAVSYTIENPDVKESGNFRPLKDRYFEDIPNKELLGSFGKITLATDMWGVLAYTARPSVVLRKLHALLADDGELYLRVGTPAYQVRKHTMFGAEKPPPSSLYASSVLTREGQTLRFPDWLMKVPGFKVEKLEDGTVLLIRKDPKQRLSIPNLRLAPEIDSAFMPPARKFIER